MMLHTVKREAKFHQLTWDISNEEREEMCDAIEKACPGLKRAQLIVRYEGGSGHEWHEHVIHLRTTQS